MSAAASTALTNQFLIAMPSLDDPNFTRSVTYVCEHTDEGAMGLVINRPLGMELGEVLRQLDVVTDDRRIEHQPVFVGGPVLPDRGFILHRPHGEWESTLRITDNVALTTSRDILNAMAHGYGPRDSIFALGYAGWGPGQLEAEMAENAWLSVAADEHVLFELPASARWRAAARLIGVDPMFLSGDWGHA